MAGGRSRKTRTWAGGRRNLQGPVHRKLLAERAAKAESREQAMFRGREHGKDHDER